MIADADIFRTQGLSGDLKHDQDHVVPATQQTRGAYYSALCFFDDRGEPRKMANLAQVDFMGSWRSFYRWVRIGRSGDAFGPVNWAAALRRLGRILGTPMVMTDYPEDSRNPKGSLPTIGSVFTSEVLIAWLLRWHVKLSVGVINRPDGAKSDQASPYLTQAYIQAATHRPTTDDEWQTHLRAGLLDELKHFQMQHPHNEDLTGNFDDIESPTWATLPPLPPGKNDRAYALNPQLRLCSRRGGSFHLAEQIADP